MDYPLSVSYIWSLCVYLFLIYLTYEIEFQYSVVLLKIWSNKFNVSQANSTASIVHKPKKKPSNQSCNLTNNYLILFS